MCRSETADLARHAGDGDRPTINHRVAGRYSYSHSHSHSHSLLEERKFMRLWPLSTDLGLCVCHGCEPKRSHCWPHAFRRTVSDKLRNKTQKDTGRNDFSAFSYSPPCPIFMFIFFHYGHLFGCLYAQCVCLLINVEMPLQIGVSFGLIAMARDKRIHSQCPTKLLG